MTAPGGFDDDAAPVTGEEREQAAGIIQALAESEQWNFLDERLIAVDEWLTVADVQDDTHQLRNQFRFLEESGLLAPLVRIGNRREVPVSLRTLAGARFPEGTFDFRGREGSYRYAPWPFVQEEWASLARELLRSAARTEDDAGPIVRLAEPEEARYSFTEAATDFVAQRIGALRRLRTDLSGRWRSVAFLAAQRHSESAPSKAPGCTFQVTTNSPGLRVHWSGAYCLNGKYFGGPTTPADGVMLSGSFVFGVDGGAYTQPVWDRVAVVVLPGQASLHLNF